MAYTVFIIYCLYSNYANLQLREYFNQGNPLKSTVTDLPKSLFRKKSNGFVKASGAKPRYVFCFMMLFPPFFDLTFGMSLPISLQLISSLRDFMEMDSLLKLYRQTSLAVRLCLENRVIVYYLNQSIQIEISYTRIRQSNHLTVHSLHNEFFCFTRRNSLCFSKCLT